MADRLEGFLRAVQDIKGDYYVGTQEAYNAVKRISSEVYENPGRTAIRVNHALKQRFTRLGYEATPERVYGVFDVLSDACLEVLDFYCEEPDETDFRLTLNYQKMIEEVGNLEDIQGNLHYRMQPSDLSRIVVPYFAYGNEREVSNDEEFGRVVIDYLMEGFEKHRNKVSLQFISDYIDWASRFLRNLDRADWNDRLSKETFNRDLSDYRNSILIDELKISNIVDRLINDRYEHRLEYRRQVLSHCLGNRLSYQELVKRAEHSIKLRKARYKKFELLNAPLEIIESERKLIQSARYLRHVLGSEKDFVKKCLGEKNER